MGVGRSVHSVSYIDFGAQGGIGICQNCHHIFGKYCENHSQRLRQLERHQLKSILPTLPHDLNKHIHIQKNLNVHVDIRE